MTDSAAPEAQRRADGALIAAFAGLVCDLDGVVYSGASAVPAAVPALRDAGVPVVFATNNASRPPEQVAEHLNSLGLRVQTRDVITSAVAGAQHLAQLLPSGSAVLAIGGEGVPLALQRAGLRPYRCDGTPWAPDQQAGEPGEHDPARTEAERGEGAGPQVLAVLQGYGTQVRAADLAEAAHAIQAGASWVATNTDATLPTDRGIAPGNGTLVSAVRQAVQVDPEVVGKPGPAMYLLAAEQLGSTPEQLLGIGDRLETDVAGARAAGMAAAHVLTGVHQAPDLVGAAPQVRPDYLLADLAGLHQPYLAPRRLSGTEWACGEAHVQCTDREVAATVTWSSSAAARTENTGAAGGLAADRGSAATTGSQGGTGHRIEAVRAAVWAAWDLLDEARLDRDAAAQWIRDTLSTDPQQTGQA
ncbi:HAD-IIA family hydrolase [Dermacoccaceae bacterium W4C1]